MRKVLFKGVIKSRIKAAIIFVVFLVSGIMIMATMAVLGVSMLYILMN